MAESQKIDHHAAITVPATNLPPPGNLCYFHVLDGSKQYSKDDAARLHDGTVRDFQITAQLGKASEIPESIAAAIPPEAGASCLLIPPQATALAVDLSSGRIIARKNIRNELSQIELSCRAQSVFMARQKFLEVVTPWLDCLCFEANVPIHITAIQVNDPLNGLWTIDFVVPHTGVKLNPHRTSAHNDLIPIYAMYREAKNNQSTFYRFLCYYKILEGILRHLRPKVFREAKKAGRQLCARKETVPDHPEFGEHLKAYVGQPLQKFFDGILSEKYRHAVAHYVTDDGSALNLSSYSDKEKFEGILFLAELSCRVAIETHEKYMAELGA